MERISRIASLAMLNISEEERERTEKDFENMVGLFDRLQEVDTSQVEPMTYAFEEENVFREDEVLDFQDTAGILENAPGKDKNLFFVPHTFE